MADILTKTNTFPSPSSLSDNYLKNKKLETENWTISVVSKSCKFKGFPLKVKPVLASWRSQTTLFSSCGKKGVVPQGDQSGRPRSSLSIKAQANGFRIGSAKKWWEKGLQPNMKEVVSAQDLVDSLMNAGDKLLIVDFFSAGCGGCKSLHPKICQLAEMNPDVQFLQVNYEEHKSMCYSLNVHVLPFFRFYRGAHGRLCSFSCTNATIKKFKDALAKHTPDRCSLGPTRGLEEKELIALAASRDLSFNYTPTPVQPEPSPAEEQSSPHSKPSLPLHLLTEALKPAVGTEDRTLVASRR